MPGGLTVGVHEAGIEVAGIDLDMNAGDFIRRFKGTRVTLTTGNGLESADVTKALSLHRGCTHTSTFTTYNCAPFTSLAHFREGQASDGSQRTISSAVGMEHQLYRDRDVAWFHESVVNSLSKMEGITGTFVSGFTTGEKTADRHIIYHEDDCPPLIDPELTHWATWLGQHTCSGGLRPIQHLGPDGVPIFLGERDPDDPSKWLRYIKPGGGWVSRRPWYCCAGDIFGVFGTPPLGVTHADWCCATGNSPEHIRKTQQLKNALRPRLGSLLGPQLVMYHMARRFGVPVIDYTESVADPQLRAWLVSILFCRGPLPCMPFYRFHIVISSSSHRHLIAPIHL